MKKQLKILIILIVIALILGGLVIASAQYGVKAVTDAVNDIGQVTYSEETRRLIDAADEEIGRLDPNLHLTERVENIDDLKAAKVKYVEMAIKRLYIAVRDRKDETLIREYLADAEEAFSHYLTEADIPLIHNYQDLEDARKKYADQTGPVNKTNEADPVAPSQPLNLC